MANEENKQDDALSQELDKQDDATAQESNKTAENKTTKSNQSASDKLDKQDEVTKYKRLTFVCGGLALCLAAVLILGALGFIGAPAHPALTQKEFKADQLNTEVARYTLDGKTVSISAREALTDMGLYNENEKSETYPMPPAEQLLVTARTQILLKEAEHQNIQANDDETLQALKQRTGSEDFKAIADQTHTSEDVIKQTMHDIAVVEKLRKKVIGDSKLPTEAPKLPADPANGKKDEKTKAYADYIISNLGDEWDASKNDWARTDGDFYKLLKDTDFSAESASYNTALQVYQMMQQHFQTIAQKENQTWSDWVSDLFSRASIEVYSLRP